MRGKEKKFIHVLGLPYKKLYHLQYQGPVKCVKNKLDLNNSGKKAILAEEPSLSRDWQQNKETACGKVLLGRSYNLNEASHLKTKQTNPPTFLHV